MTEIDSQKKKINEFKNNQMKVSLTAKDAMHEVEIVRRLKETVHILEADAAVSRHQRKDQEDRIIEQKLIVDQLQGTQKNLEQVLSDLVIQCDKLNKALKEKNRALFKGLANVGEKFYDREHVRRLELTAKVLAEQLAQLRPKGDSPAANFSPNVRPESISNGKCSPKVSGSKKYRQRDPIVISQLQEEKIRSDLELKKREAFDIKLKFFEKEMEVSRLMSILERNSRSQKSGKECIEDHKGEPVKNKKRAFKQHQVTSMISEGVPYELPTDDTKKVTSPTRHGEKNSPRRLGDRVRSYSMGIQKTARNKRVNTTPKGKHSSQLFKTWKS